MPIAPAIPLELDEQRARGRANRRSEGAASAIDRISACQKQAVANGAAAETDARSWLAAAEGQERALAQHCLGLALANQQQWAGSALAFETAFGLVPGSRAEYRTQLAALAGNARLAEGDMERALDLLDAAAEQADRLGMTDLLGEIAIDRARALVSQGDEAEAAEALATAREVAGGNPLAWLLSATLSRRMDDLIGAQTQIERAATLDPADAAIGLEAGLIAALSGRDEAARKSWQSVIALGPETPQAAAAHDYLAQLEAL